MGGCQSAPAAAHPPHHAHTRHALQILDEDPDELHQHMPRKRLPSSSDIPMTFPMWLIPARALVELDGVLLPHDEMQKRDLLVQWTPGHKKKVVLISHQWAGLRHPDPKMDQFRVLQQLLKNMAAGLVTVGKDLVAESRGVDLVMPSLEEQRNCLDWDIWYDFFGIPQIDDRGILSNVSTVPELQAAVDSIPAYCHAADFMFILAPTIRHVDTGKTISYCTWSSRGWCRAERTAVVLSEKQKSLLVVTSPRNTFALSGAEWVSSWPHDGSFTVEADRETVKDLTKQLLELKCESVSRGGDTCSWRFYKALLARFIRGEGCGKCRAIKHGHGGHSLQHQPLQDFFERYHLTSPMAAESVGLTSLMIACIEGCLPTVRNLLDLRADVNAQTQVSVQDIQLSGPHTALTIAAGLGSSEVVTCLLRANASPDVCCDELGDSALNKAAVFGNLQVISDLFNANPELLHQPNARGDSPIVCGVATHKAEVTELLLELRADPNEVGSHGHSVLALSAIHTSYIHHVELLLKAGANPDHAGAPTRLWDSLLCRAWESEVEGFLTLDGPQTPQSATSATTASSGTRESLLTFGTPLQIAAANGNLDMVRLLTRYGADATLTTRRKPLTPIQVAHSHGYSEVEVFLAESELYLET